jgi:hypothetical protein
MISMGFNSMSQEGAELVGKIKKKKWPLLKIK